MTRRGYALQSLQPLPPSEDPPAALIEKPSIAALISNDCFRVTPLQKNQNGFTLDGDFKFSSILVDLFSFKANLRHRNTSVLFLLNWLFWLTAL